MARRVEPNIVVRIRQIEKDRVYEGVVKTDGPEPMYFNYSYDRDTMSELEAMANRGVHPTELQRKHKEATKIRVGLSKDDLVDLSEMPQEGQPNVMTFPLTFATAFLAEQVNAGGSIEDTYNFRVSEAGEHHLLFQYKGNWFEVDNQGGSPRPY